MLLLYKQRTGPSRKCVTQKWGEVVASMKYAGAVHNLRGFSNASFAKTSEQSLKVHYNAEQ